MKLSVDTPYSLATIDTYTDNGATAMTTILELNLADMAIIDLCWVVGGISSAIVAHYIYTIIKR